MVRPARRRSRMVATMLAFAMGGAAQADAQERVEAFAHVEIGLGLATLDPRFPPGDFWTPEAGPTFRLQLPFVPGHLALTGQTHAVAAGADVSVPGAAPMRWYLATLAWGGSVERGAFRIGAEARLGALTSSANDTLHNHVERDPVFGGAGWLRVALGGGWAALATVEVLRAYSSTRWTPTTLSIGGTRRISLPTGASRALRDPGPRFGPPVEASGSAPRRAAPAANDARTAALARAIPADRPSWWRSFADLPFEAGALEGTGIDRVDRFWSARGTVPLEGAAPVVWLDGIPLREGTLGGSPWSWWPVGPPDIDVITVSDRPGIHASRPEPDGVVNVRTVDPGRGSGAWGRAIVFNETGDPGPLRFTPLMTPNIDGPLFEFDGGASTGWSDGSLAIQASIRDRWSSTRPETFSRNPAFNRAGSSGVRVQGTSATLRDRVGDGPLVVRGATSWGDRLARTPGTATEVATEVLFVAGGGSWGRALTPTTALELHLGGQRFRGRSPTERDVAAGAPDFEWTETDVDAGASLVGRAAGAEWSLGVDVHDATDRLDQTRLESTRTRLFGSGERSRGEWLFSGGAGAGFGGEADFVVGGLARSFGPSWTVTASSSWRGESVPEELWTFATRRQVSLAPLGITLVQPREYARAARTSSSLGLVRLGADWWGRLEVTRHGHASGLRPRRTFGVQGGQLMSSLGPLDPGEGEVWLWSLTGSAPGPRASTVEARIDRLGVSGTGAFHEWWSGTPRWRATLRTRTPVRPGWAVHTTWRARSSELWAGYANTVPIGAAPVDGIVPGGLIIDVHLTGSLLGGRLEAVTGFTNVLDRDQREHPLGAQEARGIHIGLLSRIGSRVTNR